MTRNGSAMALGLRAILSGREDVLQYDAATEVLGAAIVALIGLLGGSGGDKRDDHPDRYGVAGGQSRGGRRR